MKKLILLFVAVLFVGCENAMVPIRVSTAYPSETVVLADTTTETSSAVTTTTETTTTETTVTETPKEEIVAKTLAPIDESIVYIWDDYNKRAYYASELPDKDGDFNPHPFLYTDGSIANVIAFEFYRVDHSFYIKVSENQEVKTDGITTGWKAVERTFKQKKGVVTECSDAVFPAYDPVNITEYVYKESHLAETPDHWWVFFPDTEWGKRMGNCSYPMKYTSMIHISGDTLWIIAEKRDVDHPQLFTVEPVNTSETIRWMDYAKAVFKS